LFLWFQGRSFTERIPPGKNCDHPNAIQNLKEDTASVWIQIQNILMLCLSDCFDMNDMGVVIPQQILTLPAISSLVFLIFIRGTFHYTVGQTGSCFSVAGC
jgi:hypothetical protein